MSKFLTMTLLALILVAFGTACKSSGSREFIPGKGWVPN
jgi:hypothetical protein